MRLGQVRFDNTVTAAIFEGDRAHPIPGHTVSDLIRRSETEHTPLNELARSMAARLGVPADPVAPLFPAEIWACGCTYEMSASFRDAEHGTREGMYAYVYREPRPEIFFKGTSRVCVGPNQPIGIRSDSKFTAPEPELALVLGAKGKIVGYTLCNDVSAWDIERENALYLPQSKMYNACCALGPYMVTPDELTEPYKLEMTCTIERQGKTIFEGSVSLGKLHRKFEELTGYLLRSNNVPAASVLSTGTGIIVTEESALSPGDVVTISAPGLGKLANPAAIV